MGQQKAVGTIISMATRRGASKNLRCYFIFYCSTLNRECRLHSGVTTQADEGMKGYHFIEIDLGQVKRCFGLTQTD